MADDQPVQQGTEYMAITPKGKLLRGTRAATAHDAACYAMRSDVPPGTRIVAVCGDTVTEIPDGE